MSSKDRVEGLPIFTVRAKDKVTEKSLYINFKTSDTVPAPEDFDEKKLREEWARGVLTTTSKCQFPLQTSPIFWSKEGKDKERHYVIDVLINDKFAIRRMLTSRVIQHYVILATISTIEGSFNDPKQTTSFGQFLGHSLDFAAEYQILDSKSTSRTDEIVRNKIIPMVRDKSDNGQKITTDDVSERQYELYYRPASKILTCSLNTDKLPDSIGFNDDRIIVKLGEKNIVDIYLPFFIDLNIPVKYKYDDKSCLFRAVFKIVESNRS